MDKGETTIPAASMAMSLKPLLQSPFFGGLRHADQLKVLEAYWEGMREILRPVFDDPTEYALQKGVGVMAMHSVLPNVLELVRGLGLAVTDPQSYTQLLREPLEKLEGDDGTGNPVSGPTFWAAAPTGAAGTYSGSAGRRVLAAKVKQSLPQIEVVA